jgi:hypothetical protein
MRKFTESLLEILFTALSQLDSHIVYEGNRCFMINLVMNDVVEIDQVGFMGAEEIFAWQAILDLFQDTR